MRIEYHPRVALELNDAVTYYDKIQTGLGSQLRREVYAAIERILANPNWYKRQEEQIRRCPVRNFPWTIFYRVFDDAEVVRILVIRHQRRRPRYGLARN
ncbi:MAG: type II toxin-antitoxin system RelE/ParE family toxin [Gammaproteobacteria bacterium]|nr:type II toxin-antitoxin system RelE/ParE family toxin [Gammaproteobacteria bacterium]